MKKRLALLLCFMMTFSLASCILEPAALRDTAANTTAANLPTGNGESTTNTSPVSNEIAMEMYEAAINDEICVFDERVGEIKLKDLRFASNDTRLDECKLLKKAILDVDQDGVKEYLIQSPDQEYIILHCYNGRVYSYCVDGCDFYSFQTDGTFYWCNSPHSAEMACGLNKITFAGETLNVKFLYSLQYSKHPDEYVVEGKVVTSDEYYDYRAHHYPKESMKFSQFELTCSYPITAEQAWNLANEYWDHQDGRSERDLGSVYTARIVVIDTPNSETDYYRVAFQVARSSGGALEGYECVPPHNIQVYDQILVNAFTGEIIASTYDPNGKALSVEEAIGIAKEHCEPHCDEYGYRYEHEVNEPSPEHIYVIVVQKHDNGHNSFHTRLWIDKYSGEIVFGYYVLGK